MVLADGTYDVIIVEADDDENEDRQLHVSVTILSGAHKSEVVDLAVTNFGRPGYELLGLPGTLTVTDGLPHLRIDS